VLHRGWHEWRADRSSGRALSALLVAPPVGGPAALYGPSTASWQIAVMQRTAETTVVVRMFSPFTSAPTTSRSVMIPTSSPPLMTSSALTLSAPILAATSWRDSVTSARITLWLISVRTFIANRLGVRPTWPKQRSRMVRRESAHWGAVRPYRLPDVARSMLAWLRVQMAGH
jgi:hypothetical protein